MLVSNLPSFGDHHTDGPVIGPDGWLYFGQGTASNAGIVVPPGVAHAIRVEGSEDVIMVYGTSTSFKPEFEGRIASDVETATLPESWQRFLAK